MRKYRSLLKHTTILSIAIFFLSACSNNSQQSGTSESFFHHYVVSPFTQLINFIADSFGGSYGMAIIIVTLMIRFVMMPFMLKQYKSQAIMKDKMELLKPEMEIIQKKMKEETDPKQKQVLQQEMMGLYRKHGVNPLNVGCLPLLIQMPILTGLYYAIRSSEEITHHKFLWFSLGHPDLLLTAIAGIIYFLQFKVSQINLPSQQQNQMKFMGLISPMMIVFVSLKAPAALPLYWVVGGTFLTIQTFIGQRLYRSKKVETVVEKNV